VLGENQDDSSMSGDEAVVLFQDGPSELSDSDSDDDDDDDLAP